MSQPKIISDPLYQLLREGNIKEFNTRKAKGETCDMRGCDFRALDLRDIQADGLDWSNCYFRQADLRGVDLRKTRMEGASINKASISGVFFPIELSGVEVLNSLEYGTRMRYSMTNCGKCTPACTCQK